MRTMIPIRIKGYVRRMQHRVSTRLIFYTRLYLQRQEPVIIYQMGKVGSAGLAASIEACGHPFSFHIHRLNPANMDRVERMFAARGLPPVSYIPTERMLYRHVVRPRRRARFITLVRDPIARNLSAFFENFELMTGVQYADSQFSPEEIIRIYRDRGDHDLPLTWFDDEMKAALGIDVFSHPFPADLGYARIQQGNFELLVLQLETEDRLKEQVIADFLGLPDFKLLRTNVGAKKDYARDYREFTQRITFEPEYLDGMYSSRYVRHFYTAQQIEGFRKRWGGPRMLGEEPGAGGSRQEHP